MGVFRAAFSTWFIGLLLSIVLLVPAIKALVFVLRCVFWALEAFQSLVTGTTLPDF